MAFQIISPTREVDGRKGRILAGPKWVQPDGKLWTPIANFVRKTLGYGYRIEIPGHPGWIELTPDLAAATAIGAGITKESVGIHFGPTLEVAKTPDVMRWTVTTSPGVKRLANGDCELVTLNGVPLGLGFADWADMMTHKQGVVTLDLRARKAEALADQLSGFGDGTINLDPSTILLGEETSDWRRHWVYDPVWADARSQVNADASNQADLVVTVGYRVVQEDYLVARFATRFDTTDILAVESAKFVAHERLDRTETDMHMAKAAFIAGPGDIGAFSEIRGGPGHTDIGYIDTNEGDGWHSKAIPTELWVEPVLDLGFRHVDDVEDNIPEGTVQGPVFHAPDDEGFEPYVEYEEEAGGIVLPPGLLQSGHVLGAI